ncbi:hypothetical protein LB524_13210 [Mesorhizobium sp. ESP6-5]|uniref:hypothetical protein n=1 Tax=unclassified Mesorhizobium TaxID=325217 RepID=UPI00112629EE|nr:MULTISPECIES: hypothetical protein [unclassified Mesorhizobium]MBZ9696213.1 hypothetical protein [Mesorhizobium sp. CO1-1-9]MBZ9756250.1 hypothetical protein [Mesorhizobium sp. ESP6-5]TPK11399.1 hypothetical protein FJ543_18450 [Mesorhizobium sp. B2-5-7]
MTSAQRPSIHDDNRPANDNDVQAPEIPSVPPVCLSEDANMVDLVRRTERLAIAVVVGMAICLTLIPAIYVALTYGM